MSRQRKIHREFVANPLASGVKAALVATLLATGGVAAAQTAEEQATTLDTVSVLGTRSQPRSEAYSAVPIDIISGEEFHNQGATDVLDQLRVLVPSFNVSTIPIDDGATLVRPANLRGLPPDNTLILVNGKRRHRAAVITFLGHGLSDGAQGPDVSVYPSLALEQVEVLRDGAAAQYGSDAIAGVINFGLKRSREGGAVEAFAGEYYKGDGFTQQYAAQIGLPLTERGFATFTAEWRSADPTSRSVQRDDAAEVAAAGYPGVPDPAQIWGSPEVKEDFKFVANLGISGESADFYLFGNYAKRDVDGGFYYRNSTTRGGVFSNDGGETLLVGSPSGADCGLPILLRDADGNLLPYATVNAQLAALPGDCFTFLSLFPGGFTPRFGGEMEDSGITAGVKGVWADNLYWDLSATYGRNEIDFYMYNTVNASLGANQPAGFRFSPGGNTQTEYSFNFDLSKGFDTGFTHGPMNVATGVEWRRESFEIVAGDAASTAIGPLTEQGFSIGSNGFPGFHPDTAGKHDRDNWAVYVDAEANFTEQLLLAAAVRHEDFDDFGGTTNWKLTGRFDFTDTFAARAAYSTGFRAPTPGQANVSQITTAFIDGRLQDTATLPPTDPVAEFYGARALTPEKSRNASMGLVWNTGDWLTTLDWYRIKVKDRIARSADFEITAEDRAALIAAGHSVSPSLNQVAFFVNDFDTTTTGVDLVTSYKSDHFGGETTYSLAANWNRTKVDDFTPGIISEARVKKLEDSLPKTKGYLTLNHQREIWSANLRLNYYSSFYEDHLDGEGDLPIYGGSALTVDVDVGWKFASGFYFQRWRAEPARQDPGRESVGRPGRGREVSGAHAVRLQRRLLLRAGGFQFLSPACTEPQKTPRKRGFLVVRPAEGKAPDLLDDRGTGSEGPWMRMSPGTGQGRRLRLDFAPKGLRSRRSDMTDGPGSALLGWACFAFQPNRATRRGLPALTAKSRRRPPPRAAAGGHSPSRPAGRVGTAR
ncbi:TonB-dependent receptor plug domain-containing protein [Marilutibacter alkalisoli]|uniref:TonB-dependent receptor plug domain-containing protein n=1 Tax=Marilutibacter alkalisoli TaxID=2591633 RepID=UPI001FC9C456|nr:TonB-dependent receptor [Lysobacter alkalisoli]